MRVGDREYAVITTPMPAAWRARIEEIARAEHRSMSSVMRALVYEAFAARGERLPGYEVLSEPSLAEDDEVEEEG